MEKNKNQQVSVEETMVKESRAADNSGSRKTTIKKADNANHSWQNVMIGGIPGILLGVGGVFAAQAFTVNHEEDQGDYGGQGSHAGEGDIPVADNVNDEMSFNEAFAAAREEVGPGGAFSWHGNLYSTYRSDDPEWVEMGPDGQAAHCHDIVAQVHAEPYTPDTSDTPDVPEASDVPETSDSESNPASEQESAPESEPDSEAGLDSEPEVEVQILGVEVDGETGIAAAYGYVNGHETVFADLDGDNGVDIVLHDANDDQEITPDEVFDATESGITIDDLQAGAELSSEVDSGLTDVDADLGV